jgi:ubiquinone/menaquinone biosynthesis C-methylase UbiE
MTDIPFDTAARAYDRFMGRWSRLYCPVLLDRAGVAPGQRVLDVAAGTGEAALAVAARLGSGGCVLATDLSVPMLQAARPKTRERGVTLVAMDGQALACRDACVDALICQLGLMFFPDPARGLAGFRRVLKPGGRLAVSVWSAPERVPFVGMLLQTLAAHVPAQARAIMAGCSLGDPGLLRDLLAGAGFSRVEVTGEIRQIAFESFEDYWEPIAAGGGRAGVVYGGLPEAGKRAVEEEVRRRLARFESGGRLVMEAEMLVASGVA